MKYNNVVPGLSSTSKVPLIPKILSAPYQGFTGTLPFIGQHGFVQTLMYIADTHVIPQLIPYTSRCRPLWLCEVPRQLTSYTTSEHKHESAEAVCKPRSEPEVTASSICVLCMQYAEGTLHASSIKCGMHQRVHTYLQEICSTEPGYLAAW